MQEVKKRKMKIWFKIILVPLLFQITATVAQVGLKFEYPVEKSTLSLNFDNTIFDYNLSALKININTDTGFRNFSSLNQNFKPFPKIYSYHNLAFFCKIEVKLEKAAKFPVKFRLGDVNYVDQLEGK